MAAEFEPRGGVPGPAGDGYNEHLYDHPGHKRVPHHSDPQHHPYHHGLPGHGQPSLAHTRHHPVHHHTVDTEQSKFGRAMAQQVEGAVQHDKPDLFQQAMEGVNSYLNNDPHGKRGAKQFSSAFFHKLKTDGTLPQVALYEARHDLERNPSLPALSPDSFQAQNRVQGGLLDKASQLSNPNGGDLTHPPTITNEGVAGAMNKVAAQEYDAGLKTLNQKGSDGYSMLDKLKADPDLLDSNGQLDAAKVREKMHWQGSMLKSEQRAALRSLLQTPSLMPGGLASTEGGAAMQHMFEKKPGEQSLYDRLDKDEHGNIKGGAIERLRGTAGLSDADAKSLDYLKLQKSWHMMSSTPDMQASQLNDLASQNGAEVPKEHPASVPEVRHLFEKRPGQELSLFDRLAKSPNGDIAPGAIQNLLGTAGLSQEDINSLHYMQSRQRWWQQLGNYLPASMSPNDIDRSQFK